MNLLRARSCVIIPLFSALKWGDRKIRVNVQRVQYAQKKSVDRWQFSFFYKTGGNLYDDLPPKPAFFYKGLPLNNWFSQKSLEILRDSPIRPMVNAQYAFREEVEFQCEGLPVKLIGLKLLLFCSEIWVKQTIDEDVSLGSYDVLNKRLLIPNEQSWYLGPYDNEKWESSSPPPLIEDKLPKDTPWCNESASAQITMTLFNPIAKDHQFGIPELDELISESVLL